MHLNEYARFIQEHKICCLDGFIFRVRDNSSREIVNKPVSSGSMADRLKIHLSAINLYDGETAHSGRRGCTMTLKMPGFADGTINQHLGWGGDDMLRHYAGITHLSAPGNVAETLSLAASRDKRDNLSSLGKASAGILAVRNLERYFSW